MIFLMKTGMILERFGVDMPYILWEDVMSKVDVDGNGTVSIGEVIMGLMLGLYWVYTGFILVFAVLCCFQLKLSTVAGEFMMGMKQAVADTHDTAGGGIDSVAKDRDRLGAGAK